FFQSTANTTFDINTELVAVRQKIEATKRGIVATDGAKDEATLQRLVSALSQLQDKENLLIKQENLLVEQHLKQAAGPVLERFTRLLMDYYSIRNKKDCMVLGERSSSKVISCHIWPYSKRAQLTNGPLLNLTSTDIDNPRNGLRLAKEIELAFDSKILTIVPNVDADGLKIFLLNKSYSSIVIPSSYKRVTFGDIH
ncbi:unnamed protein product, partial [Didymodactylos carnosus]